MVEYKKYYVLIERIGAGPNINGYDTWICPWKDLDAFLTPPLEETEEGVPFTVRLTVLSFTDEEYVRYCAEHEIETDEI